MDRAAIQNIPQQLNFIKMKKAVLSLSGGMDSSTVLLHLLNKDYEVRAICIDYGQKHSVEIERAKTLWNYLCEAGLVELQNFHLLKFPLQDLVHSALMKGGNDVPEGHYESENMKETVVPNRNKIFSSIIQAAALSWAVETNSEVDIAMGIHAGDHAIYPDCRQEFRDADHNAFLQGNWDANLVNVYTPYLEGDKFDILKDGLQCCEDLSLDFNEVYRNTNTSYKPIFISKFPKTYDIKKAGEGKWYSDYKSASSVERIEAFIKLERPDPVVYADETGPVSWEVAKAHVEKILEDGSK